MALALTGVGMVTALGYGAVGSCAAIRAGLSRPRELDGFTVADGEGGSHTVVGHPIEGYAEGFFRAGAWLRLAAGGLEDLSHRAGLPSSREAGFWKRTGLIALTPLVEQERMGWSLEEQPNALRESFALPLVQRLRWPIASEHVRVLGLGHCGLALGLQQARALIAERHLDRIVLVGADSYLDPGSLAWLYEDDRLKGPQRPAGLMPGQAGTSVLVESQAAARARGAVPRLQLKAVAVSEVEASPRPAPVSIGRSLARTIMEALDEAGQHEPFQGHLVLDLNGEEWRALSWGHAQVHLASRVSFDQCRNHVPAESLGDVGAASGPLGVGVAAYALLRPSEGEHALICAISDRGQIGVILLGRV